MAVNSLGNYFSDVRVAENKKAIKLEKKHPIGRRYRVVKSVLSSKKTSSTPKTSKPKSINKIPALEYSDTLLRLIILNE